MSTEIKIDTVDFCNQANKLKEALTEFTPYCKQFSGWCQQDISRMSSDFIDGLSGVLRHLSNKVGIDLLHKIEAYQQDIALLADKFATTDSQLAQDISLGSHTGG